MRRRGQFLACASSRRKWSCPGFMLQVRTWTDRDRSRPERLVQGGPPAGLPEARPCSDPDAASVVRVGFTASKKVGNAVTRNRARRRLKALAATVLAVEAAPDCDYVLVARTGTPDIPFDRLARDLRRGLDKLGAMRAPDGAEPGRSRLPTGNP